MPDFKWDGFLGDVLTAGAKNIQSTADQSAAKNNSELVRSGPGMQMPPWIWYAAAAGAALVGFLILRKR